MLQLLNQWDPLYVRYIRRNTATRGELEYYLHKWTQKTYCDYPILYLAVHGARGDIYLGDRRRADGWVRFKWLQEQLGGKCRGRIIILPGARAWTFTESD